MKKKKILKRLEKAMKAQQICKMHFVYHPDELCRFQPVKIGENLILMIKDAKPSKHGYVIRRLDAVEKVKAEDESVKISSKSEKKNAKAILETDLTDWHSAFRSLGRLGQVVVVECEANTDPAHNYAIGKIEKIGKKQVGIRYYGPDSEWADKKWKIPYSDMTRVTIASSYTEVLSQYVPEGEAEIVPDTDKEFNTDSCVPEGETEIVPDTDKECSTDSREQEEPAASEQSES